MKRIGGRRLAAWAFPGVAVAIAIAPIVMASGTAVAANRADDANRDRGAAEAALKEVEASPKKDVATVFLAKARAALERASKLRAAGDEPHARLADGLALAWAEAASDTLRAASAEEKAAAAARSANDAGAQAERERALLEESITRSGRLRAELDALERKSKEEPARTSKSASKSENESAGAAKPKAAEKANEASKAKNRGAR
ncbi:MAG: hypothetical protein FWD73_05155 [Polyangiaceae bacterium]|nr:hypothetical protein [Polyangiaceae bacterium]